MLASEVKAGGKTVTLRDAQGKPVWRGKGPGGRQKFLGPNPRPRPRRNNWRWDSFSGKKTCQSRGFVLKIKIT